MKLYELTYPSNEHPVKPREWYEKLANRINSDHPESAILRNTPNGTSVFITEDYWDEVTNYVKKKCKKNDR